MKGPYYPKALHFLQQNLKFGMYFYLSAITLQNKIALIKLIFSSISRLNQSSPMNSTVTNKIKHFPQLFAFTHRNFFLDQSLPPD